MVLCTQSACDLQPKISSLPDTVGDFIVDRYPALLADPYAQPEIYNSAAMDYGMYASPDLYGGDVTDDYVMYASVDDYVIPPQGQAAPDAMTEQNVTVEPDVAVVENGTVADVVTDDVADDYLVVPMYGGANEKVDTNQIVVQRGDTLYKLAQKYNTSVDDLAALNNLSRPYTLEIGQKLNVAKNITAEKPDVLVVNKPRAAVRGATRVQLADVVVGPGDTLYSMSRRYSVPVNDLAVMNDLKPPFVLSVGQKIKVPDLANAKNATNATKVTTQNVSQKKQTNVTVNKKVPADKPQQVSVARTNPPRASAPQKKISSDPNKKLPKITARSSSKFAWPVRGKILSNYGAKTNGLFNDGINIAAARGTVVKAAENGVVAYAGNEVKGMGNLIIIQHDAGWMTVYAHMDSLAVRRGARVGVGQKIGTVGETGKVNSPQLHFEIRKGTRAYNPTEHMKK